MKKIKGHIQNQTYALKNDMSFYPRVVNKTNIIFSDQELGLLNKSLKYNLSKKQKQWISNLAMEAEMAITLLPPDEQDYVHHQVAKNIKKLYQQQEQGNTYRNKQAYKEDRIMKHIKYKLSKNKAIISKGDKSNSSLVL